LAAPAVAVKVKADGVGTVVRLKVTGTCSGLFVAPVALSVMVPLFIPGDARAGLTVTEIAVTPVVPVAGLTDSQFPELDAEAVNGICPPVEAVTERFCGSGTAPFTELKADKAEACRLNDGGVTVRLTASVCGSFVAGA
jgi:hypothetical protein